MRVKLIYAGEPTTQKKERQGSLHGGWREIVSHVGHQVLSPHSALACPALACPACVRRYGSAAASSLPRQNVSPPAATLVTMASVYLFFPKSS